MSKLKNNALRIAELVKQLEKNPDDAGIKKDIRGFVADISGILKEKALAGPSEKIAKKTSAKKIPENHKTGKELISNDLKKKYMEDIKLEKEFLREFTKPKKEIKAVKDVEYTIYETNSYGKLANSFFENFGVYLANKFPDVFKSLYRFLKSSNIKILSKTYVSIILFSGFLVGFFVLFGALVLSVLFGVDIINSVIRSIAFSLVAGVLTLVLVYFYPAMIVGGKRRKIKEDLPFVILHMAAVAGSGAQPISIFNLVLSSGEYKGLEPEIKKIVNYVNLFGYDLSTALRAVASTTPSPEFKELLTGITSTIETGGDLKSYLKGKAEDTLTTYKLDRKKYVTAMGTYSDVYTGILIAAPLLFSVTLTIINMMGGNIGPFNIKTLSIVGVYGVIPLLNFGFIIFLNSIQPG